MGVSNIFEFDFDLYFSDGLVQPPSADVGFDLNQFVMKPETPKDPAVEEVGWCLEGYPSW